LECFEPFSYCTKIDAKLAKLVPLTYKFAAKRTHPIHSIRHKTHVFGHIGPFRYSTKFDAKLAELVPLTHKFAKEGLVRIFRNERTRSTPLDAKLMFRGVLDRFGTARKSLQNRPNSRH
jgi:hypothetical protein